MYVKFSSNGQMDKKTIKLLVHYRSVKASIDFTLLKYGNTRIMGKNKSWQFLLSLATK